MSNTQTLHNFLITRDGQIDWTLHEALEREEKRRIVKASLKDCKAFLGHAALASIKYMGKGTLRVIDELVEAAR